MLDAARLGVSLYRISKYVISKIRKADIHCRLADTSLALAVGSEAAFARGMYPKLLYESPCSR